MIYLSKHLYIYVYLSFFLKIKWMFILVIGSVSDPDHFFNLDPDPVFSNFSESR